MSKDAFHAIGSHLKQLSERLTLIEASRAHAVAIDGSKLAAEGDSIGSVVQDLTTALQANIEAREAYEAATLQTFRDVMEALVEALNTPKEVEFDAEGNPVRLRPVAKRLDS